MIVPTYEPGDWYAVVTNGTIAVLPSTTDTAVVSALWDAARGGEGLTTQLQVLLARPLADLPPFALVTVGSGRVHAVVRGDVVVAVATGTGTRTVAAGEVSTWTEEVVDGAHSVTVRVGPPATSAGALPVLSAVVRVATVRLELTAGAGSAAGGTDAPLEQAQTGPLRLPPESARSAAAEPEAARAAAPEPGPGRSAAPEPGVLPQPRPEPLREPVPAPLPEPLPEPVPVPAVGDVPGPTEDHDGLTVLSSDVVALRRQMPRWAGDEVPGPLAVPDAGTRPPAKIVLSSGLVVSLNRPVLLGRAPQVSRVSNERLPRLVTVASPNQDISRTHAEVRQDGEDVLVTDLRSTNGVLLLRQNGTPQRLHPGEPTVVEPGVVVDLGEGVTFTVEHGT